MKKSTLLIIAFLFGVINVHSQDVSTMKGAYYCSQKKINNPNYIRLTPQPLVTPKHSFDVLDYKLNLNIYDCFKTPYPKTFSALETIKFRVDSALNTIKLNAVNTSIAIDSVRLIRLNYPLTFSHTGDILTINMNRTYNPGEIVNVKIYYRHLSIADNAFYVYQGMVFTDCEPEGARKWYPCWDKPSDKATIDLTAKVPSNVRLGSNGRLNDSTVTADTIYYHWISKDPVSTYLVVMTAKVGYNLQILYWHKISNPADSIPIRYYYNSGENISPSSGVILDMTTYYSQKFCEHPFEKNGFTAWVGD